MNIQCQKQAQWNKQHSFCSEKSLCSLINQDQCPNFSVECPEETLWNFQCQFLHCITVYNELMLSSSLTYGYFLVINEIIFINMVTVSLLVTPWSYKSHPLFQNAYKSAFFLWWCQFWPCSNYDKLILCKFLYLIHVFSTSLLWFPWTFLHWTRGSVEGI